jgi:hypothetical protein
VYVAYGGPDVELARKSLVGELHAEGYRLADQRMDGRRLVERGEEPAEDGRGPMKPVRFGTHSTIELLEL